VGVAPDHFAVLRFSPGQLNPFDESLGYIAANAHNDGLRAGYIHGAGMDDVATKALLHRLRSLSPHTEAGNGIGCIKLVTSSNWRP
jgi:hypothetical protein